MRIAGRVFGKCAGGYAVVETGTIKTVTITDSGCICEVNFGADVVETCVLYENIGNNNYPLPDDEVAVSLSNGQNTILAVFRPIPDDLKAGEQVIYSRDSSGTIQANIKFKNDGEINLNDGDDFAVKFNELKTAFDTLKNDFNTFVKTSGNVHTHICAAPGVASATPLPIGKETTSDMSNAKVEKVKL